MKTLLMGLLSLVRPILNRVLAALGFAVVNIVGVSAAIQWGKDEVMAALSGASGLGQGTAAAMQLAGLAGVWTGLGLVFGAMTFAGTMFAIRKASSIVGVAS